MPTQRCTPHDRTTPPVVSSCPLSSTMWKNVIVSNASVPWKVSHLTQSLCLLFKCFTTTGALLWSYHVQTLQFRDSEMVSLTYGPIRCGWMLIGTDQLCFDQISRVRSDCFPSFFSNSGAGEFSGGWHSFIQSLYACHTHCNILCWNCSTQSDKTSTSE